MSGNAAPHRDAVQPMSGAARLRLLGGFEVAVGDATVALQLNAQRLVALLALADRSVLRAFVASTLCLNTTEDKAHASLRSTLWRVRQCGCDLVEVSNARLCLAPGVDVDVRNMVRQTSRLLATGAALQAGDEDIAPLQQPLLPEWWDDWVLLERERLRQLQLHALERLGERLLANGRVVDALEAGLAAVATEPLRESAHRLVVRIHLVEGNHSEAFRHYAQYRHLLWEELGVAPSHQMERLVAAWSDMAIPLRQAREAVTSR